MFFPHKSPGSRTSLSILSNQYWLIKIGFEGAKKANKMEISAIFYQITINLFRDVAKQYFSGSKTSSFLGSISVDHESAETSGVNVINIL